MSDNIPIKSEQDIKKLLEFFFGQQAKSWIISPRLIENLAKILVENKKCRNAMNMVPRPSAIYTPKWAIDQIIDISKRYVVEVLKEGNSNNNSIDAYDICKNQIGRYYKSEMSMIGQGL